MKYLFILSIFFSFSLLFAGPQCCGTKGLEKAKMEKTKDLKLCSKCGEVKGAEKCCKPDMKKCSKCDLHKGAPGCCKMEKGKDAKLCSKCGEMKGDKKCCNPDIKKCDKCGMHKGSPACCIKPSKDKKGMKAMKCGPRGC